MTGATTRKEDRGGSAGRGGLETLESVGNVLGELSSRKEDNLCVRLLSA